MHGLFEKDEETKELEESARDLCARLRVCSMETVKTPEGYTGIDAVVEVAPPARKASKKDAVKRKGKGGKGQEEKEESTMFHFKFRREQVGSKEMYDVKPLPTDEEEDEEEEEGEEEMKAKEKGAAKGAKAAGAAKSKAAEKEKEKEEEEEGESDEESEEPPPKVMVNYTISAVKGHGRPEPLLEMNILSLYLAPSNAGVLPVGEEDEEADEDDEEREVPDRAMVSSLFIYLCLYMYTCLCWIEWKMPIPFSLTETRVGLERQVGVDEEGLARAVEWIGMDGQLDAPQLLVRRIIPKLTPLPPDVAALIVVSILTLFPHCHSCVRFLLCNRHY